MRWLRLLVGDVQTHLSDRCSVSYLYHLGTPRTCRSRTIVNNEGPASNKIVSRLREHDFAADGSMMRTFWNFEAVLYLGPASSLPSQ